MKKRGTLYKLTIILILIIGSSVGMQAQKKSTKSDPNIPIFEIKNDAGQTVFAVYPGGVKIFVDDQLKATGGGFTVGRIGTEKATGGDIFSVNPNDVRVNIDDALKATGGGFTVGRIGTEKATADDYFSVQPNDVRVIINDAGGLKATGGGFTVGRIGTEKASGVEENFLKVTPDSTRVYIDSSSTAGFAVGKIGATSGLQNFMYMKKDNYFIGHNSGKFTTGLYNLFLGYESGIANTTGNNNTFLGYQTGYTNTGGQRNVFVGDKSGYGNETGNFNTFLGTSSGISNVDGNYSTFIGYQAGMNAVSRGFNTCVGYNSGASGVDGLNRAYFGYSAGSSSTGDDNTYLGAEAGYYSGAGAGNVYIGTGAGRVATGNNNILIGKFAGYSAKGSSNVLIGPGAGWSLQRSDILIIDNSSDTLTPLIYGEFSTNRLALNGNVGVNRAAYSNAAFGVNPNSLGYGLYVDAGSTIYAGYFNGNLYATGTSTSSDIRFKKNIIKIDNALNKIKNIRGVYYDWKVDDFKDKGFDNTHQIGVIAQEIEKVLPELVKTDDEGYKAVAYDKLTAVLIEAVKEQQKQIEALKEKNNTLSQKVSEIDELKAEMTELKALVKEIAGTASESKSESAK